MFSIRGGIELKLVCISWGVAFGQQNQRVGIGRFKMRKVLCGISTPGQDKDVLGVCMLGDLASSTGTVIHTGCVYLTVPTA